MTRYFALALTTLSCACGSLPVAVPSNAPNAMIMTSPQPSEASLPNAQSARSTVPMTAVDQNDESLRLTGEEQKDSTLKAVSRAIHLYWFFGSR